MMIGGYQPARSQGSRMQAGSHSQAQQQLEQSAEKVEQLLAEGTKAETPQEKLLKLNQVLEETKKAVAQDTGKPLDQKNREVRLATQLLTENKDMRQNLDRRKKAESAQYTRTVTRAEEVSMNMLMGDLVHPDANQARSARKRLQELGVQEELLNAITEEMKKARAKGKGKAVQFGGGHGQGQAPINPFGSFGGVGPAGAVANPAPWAGGNLSDMMQAARQQMTQHSGMNQILNAGCDQQLDTLHHAVKPLLFGSGAWVVVDHDHNGYPVTEWSNNGP